MITIRFASHAGIFDALCKFAQYGFWPTHCEAVLPDGRRLGSWFHKGGVKIQPSDYDAGAFTKELVIDLKTTDAQAEAFHHFLIDQLDKPYDWRAIVSFYSKRSGRRWQDNDSWFCSELIGSALTAAGIFPKHMAVKFSRLTVRDLLLLSSMITEGG